MLRNELQVVCSFFLFSYFVGFQQEKVFPRYNFNTNYFIFTTLKLLVR
jgi:hypothetical protein